MTSLTDAAALAVPSLVVLAGLAGGLVARVVLSRLRHAAERTKSAIDDIAIEMVRGPIVVWGALLGLYAAIEVGEPPPATGRVLRGVVLIGVILSMTWVVARLAGVLAARAVADQRTRLPGVTLVTRRRARTAMLSAADSPG
jgi:hypothetical protein